jgi:hypothetical protein
MRRKHPMTWSRSTSRLARSSRRRSETFGLEQDAVGWKCYGDAAIRSRRFGSLSPDRFPGLDPGIAMMSAIQVNRVMP